MSESEEIILTRRFKMRLYVSAPVRLILHGMDRLRTEVMSLGTVTSVLISVRHVVLTTSLLHGGQRNVVIRSGADTRYGTLNA